MRSISWVQRGCGGELRVNRHGPQVRKHAEDRAQAEQSLFGPHCCVGIRPFWPANGAEQHRIAVLAARYRAGGEGVTDGVYRGAADELITEFEAVPVHLGNSLEHCTPGRRYLGADAVPCEHRYHGFHGRVSSNVAVASDCCNR